MMAILAKYKKIFIGIFLGAVLGYLYWQQIGCATGSCAITSSPINATLYGSLMGGLFANIFQKKEEGSV